MQNDNSLRQCYWLLPGHELDAFPKHLPSAEAAELLASWVGLWHPRLLVQLGGIPQWHSAAQAPETLSGSLLVIPDLARPELWCELSALEANSECLVLLPKSGWQEFQHQVLSAVNLSSADAAEDDLADELRFDFAALGYAYLQIQLMTRQLRYTSNLDQLLFSEQATSAAEAALAGDREKAEELLQACFDTLGQERDHYYSLEVHLLEVVLLAESTIGKSLRSQLESASPAASYLASAELLEQVKQLQPDNFQQLQEQLSESACVVGGLSSERPHPLMPRDCFPRDLARGQAGYRSVGVEPPSVFARLSFGLTSDHAADLKRFGFSGALLIPWSGGKYPDGNQAKISWESSDGIYLSALATNVLDAADDASFLSLGWHVGQALDHQHVPSILFAHWAGKQSPYLQLLQIVARRTPALGRWMRADKYFQETDEPYHQERLSASAFRYNWLANSESPADLLAATQALHRLWARSRSLLNLYNLSWQLEHVRTQATSAESESQDPPGKADHPLAEATQVDNEYRSDQSDASQTMAVKEETSPTEHVALPLSQLEHQLEQLLEVQDALLDAPADFKKQSESGFRLADQLARDILKRLAEQLVPGSSVQDPSSNASDKAESESSARGRLLLNPRSGPLRVRVRSDSDQHFAEADWNYSSGRVGHDRYSCIDVPSLGFVFAPWTAQAPAARRDRNLAEGGGLVQNEFLEAQVDPARGHLRSLHVPARRGNRLSVMVARRDRQGDGGFTYSEMVATDVRMLT
ncbi:MAG: hypothetical protein NXI32_21600, partial [bacterium]|nr:hypothetical protein [bacterium]